MNPFRVQNLFKKKYVLIGILKSFLCSIKKSKTIITEKMSPKMVNIKELQSLGF
jgi:hypothetical protein